MLCRQATFNDIGETMPKDAKDLKQMFLQKKPCLILLAASRIEKPYVSVLMKEADTTFAHTTNILSDMESYGLIEFAAEGRMKYVRLTKAGKEVARSLENINGILDGKTVSKSLRGLEKRLDRLEENLKDGIKDERTLKFRQKKFDGIIERATAIEAEASRYNNAELNGAISRLKERLDYLKTKFSVAEITPQDTLEQWLDT